MKVLKISCVDDVMGVYLPIMNGEYKYIEMGQKVNTDEFNAAIDTVVRYFAQEQIKYAIVDLKKRDDIQKEKIHDLIRKIKSPKHKEGNNINGVKKGNQETQKEKETENESNKSDK